MSRAERRRDEKLRLQLYATRECGECDACCTTERVVWSEGELRETKKKEEQKRSLGLVGEKPAGERCRYLKTEEERGCGIYKDRPLVCKVWACVWRSGSDLLLGEERPDKLGVVFDTNSHPDLPFTFLVAKESRDGGFTSAAPVLKRLLEKGHVILVEPPPGSPFEKTWLIHESQSEKKAAIERVMASRPSAGIKEEESK